MPQWIVDLVGESLAPIVWVAIVAVLVCLLAIVVIFLARKMMGGTIGVTARSRAPRLAVMDVARIDEKRRLILIRRDEVEHLVLVGGQNDVVVEGNILRLPAAGANDPSLGDVFHEGAGERPGGRAPARVAPAPGPTTRNEPRAVASAAAVATAASAHPPVAAPAPRALPERPMPNDEAVRVAPRVAARPFSEPEQMPAIEPQQRETAFRAATQPKSSATPAAAQAAAASRPAPIPAPVADPVNVANAAPGTTAAVSPTVSPNRSAAATGAEAATATERPTSRVSAAEQTKAAPNAPQPGPVEANELSIPRANLRRMIDEMPQGEASSQGQGKGRIDDPKPRPLSVTSFATAIQNRKAFAEPATVPVAPAPSPSAVPSPASRSGTDAGMNVAPSVPGTAEARSAQRNAGNAAVAWPSIDTQPKSPKASAPAVFVDPASSPAPAPAPAPAASAAPAAASGTAAKETSKESRGDDPDDEPSLEDFLTAELDSGFDDDWPSWETPETKPAIDDAAAKPAAKADPVSKWSLDTPGQAAEGDSRSLSPQSDTPEPQRPERPAIRAMTWPVADAPTRDATPAVEGESQKGSAAPTIDPVDAIGSPAERRLEPKPTEDRAPTDQAPRRLTMEEEMERLLGDFGFDSAPEEKRRWDR